jgi:hypothetical protein
MDQERRRIKVALPGNVIKEGVEVHMISSDERWSSVTLEDGTTIRMKQTVTQVIKIEGEFDPEGNPMYVTKTANLMVVDAPDALRRGE